MDKKIIDKELTKLINSGDIYNLQKVNSFLHFAPKDVIKELYKVYKNEWIERGTFTYYAEDFPKYQNSAKLDNSLETFALYFIFEAIRDI